jgi:hypothetical protein
MPAAVAKRPVYGTAAVIGILYNRGIKADRERIALLSDLVFGDHVRFRPEPGSKRRWDAEQLGFLLTTFELLSRYGVTLAELQQRAEAYDGNPLDRGRNLVTSICEDRAQALQTLCQTILETMAA